MEDTKIWIGNDNSLRENILSMIDVDNYGGIKYFKECTDIYFYRKNCKFDIRVNSNNNHQNFKNHKNKEILL